eukprot:UN07827
MRELSDIGVTAIVVSWWGRPYLDEDEHTKKAINTDDVLPLVFDAAEKYGIEVAIHLEPYDERTIYSVRSDIKYILDNYGDHPALYKRKNNSNE